MIKYIGSKRVLVPAIVETIARLPGVRTVLDLFSGTSRVGMALKAAGYEVTANDANAYAACLALCYVQADRRRWAGEAQALLAELGAVPPAAGYFTDTFCVRSRFFQPQNGARIDAIREEIARRRLHPELEAIALVSLLEAADRVDSTTGLQMAYLKSWAARSFRDLELRLPELLDGPGRAIEGDARETAGRVAADVVYLDPPYNQHSYLGNYHAWESLVRWDKPEVYGVACKRVDCRSRQSPFNSRRAILGALEQVIGSLDARFLVLSFNNEGFLTEEQIVALLSTRGEVAVESFDFKRYVGAQIGVFNPSGERVGKVSHLRNRELLFVCRVTSAPRRVSRETSPPQVAGGFT